MPWTRTHTERWGDRFPIGEDDRKGGLRSYGGGKKINGKKRHILVDTQRLVLKVKVHEAGLHDRTGAKLVLEGLSGRFSRMRKVWTDHAYRGLKEWMRITLGWELEVVRHPWAGRVWVVGDQEPPSRPKGFVVLPRRWVVERTFAWLVRNRRLSKDYEYLAETEESFVYAAMVRLMLRRLAHPA